MYNKYVFAKLPYGILSLESFMFIICFEFFDKGLNRSHKILNEIKIDFNDFFLCRDEKLWFIRLIFLTNTAFAQLWDSTG